MKITGAMVLSVAGVIAAFLTFLSGFMDWPLALGFAGGIMLVGNMLAFGAEVERQRKPKQPEPYPVWLERITREEVMYRKMRH